MPNTSPASSHISLHGKTYKIPTRPTVVICIDGFDPEYLTRGIEDGLLPTFQKLVKDGFHAIAHVAMPTLTNPNNVSIITGAPTSVHGISGNYFLDRETGKETMITDASLLRGSTILAKMANRGVRVAAITAKDKLRKILGQGLTGDNSVCFSAEHADDNTQQWLGLPRPSQYSGKLSLFVLDAGVKLLEEKRADLFYLTLSDYIQHKHAPGEKESDEFLAAVDTRIKRLLDLGVLVGVTGDHGMSDKCHADGTPNVLFLQDELEAKFGDGCARVICPITDPFVKHHGALGSFVRVYVGKDYISSVGAMIRHCEGLDQVSVVKLGEEAAKAYEMPLDREGDFVVVSQKNAVIGSKAVEHDLRGLAGHRLRSHGGRSEQPVPLLMSEKPSEVDDNKTWRNFDVFDLVLNYSA